MNRKNKIFIFAVLTAFSLTSCSLLPSLPTPQNNSSSASSSISESSFDPNARYYNVTFNSNGGTSVESQKVKEGEYAKKPANPRREGYAFNGWWYDGNLFSFTTTRIYKDILLFADWIQTAETYVATFYNEDGSFLEKQIGLTYGSYATYNGPDPVKPDHLRQPDYEYYFNGWDKDLRIYGNTDFFATYREEYVGSQTIQWMLETHVEGQYGQVPYDIYKATDGSDRRKVMIEAREGRLAEGSSFKSDNLGSSGFMKLSSNGMSVSYTINLSGYTSGTIYMRAAMDSWSSLQTNSNLDYYYGGSANSAPNGNFSLSVNNVEVDFSHMRGVPYYAMLNGGEDYFGSSSYSPVAECEVGATNLYNGLNTITYTRLASYNLSVSHFVIYLNKPGETAHQHTYNESVWSHDGIGHWHPCTSCDRGKKDYSTHSWGVWEILTEPTCNSEGLQKHTCSVCGYSETQVTNRTDHNLYALSTFGGADGFVNATLYECLYCQEQVIRWNATEYNVDLSNDVERNSNYVRFLSGKVENADGVEQRGAHIVYKIEMPYAMNNVAFAFNAAPNSSANSVFDSVESDTYKGYEKDASGNLVLSEKRYGLCVNGQTIRLGEDPYQGTRSSTQAWYNWPVTFNLVAGENTIDMWCYGSYRARMYEFQISGDAQGAQTHKHTLSDWKSDGVYHWKECINKNCYLGAGVEFYKAKHTYSSPVLKNDGSYEYMCTVCGHKKIRDASAFENEWSDDEIIAGCNNPSPTIKTYADGRRGIKTTTLNNSNGYSLTLSCVSDKARVANLKLLISVKISNINSIGFWHQSGAEKMRITVNGEQVQAPETDINFNDYECTVPDELATDNGALSVPVWIDICDVDLIAGENRLVFTIITNAYNFILCGAKVEAL